MKADEAGARDRNETGSGRPIHSAQQPGGVTLPLCVGVKARERQAGRQALLFKDEGNLARAFTLDPPSQLQRKQLHSSCL